MQLVLRVLGLRCWTSQENRLKAPEVRYPEFFLMKAATDIILSPKEDISLIESFALVMYICLYKFDYT